MRLWSGLVVLWVALLLLSCQSVDRLPLGKVYERSAKNVDRNPLIVIHGIGGSKLLERDTHKVVWGALVDDAIPLSSERGMRDLALPVWEGNPLPLGDELYACCPLRSFDVEVAGLHFSISIYRKLLHSLGIGKYRFVWSPDSPAYGKGCSCFTFFYDWRLDNVENARRLGAFLANRAAIVEEQRRALGLPKKPIRFDIVAHSMGGLIARYYLRYGTDDVLAEEKPKVTWKGAKHIGRLFLVGTPNLGSVEALKSMLHGEELAPFLAKLSPVVVATFPSAYQLLPSPHWQVFFSPQGEPVPLDLYDPKVWQKNEWGIFHPKNRPYALRLMGKEGFRRFREEALPVLLQRAKNFHRVLQIVPERPCPAQIYLFAANQVPTRQEVVVRSGSQKLVLDFHHPRVWGRGDGIVPLKSALGDLRRSESESRLKTCIPWSGVYLFFGTHREMVESEAFRNNLLFLLLETPHYLEKKRQ